MAILVSYCNPSPFRSTKCLHQVSYQDFLVGFSGSTGLLGFFSILYWMRYGDGRGMVKCGPALKRVNIASGIAMGV